MALSTIRRLAEVARRVGEAARRTPRLTVALMMLATTLLVWAPFLGRREVLYGYWDGPHYVYLARTLYDVPAEHPFAAYGLTPPYYATHLPAYPLLIRALAVVTLGHYLPAMLLATLVSSMAAAVLFHEVLVRFEMVRSPLWTAILFAVLPPRWVVYHSVGASEPLFLCFVFLALLGYRARRPWALVSFIALASLTRIMGVLLVPAFVASALLERRFREALLTPLALLATLGLFLWHLYLYGDFFAYFTRNLVHAGYMSRRPLLNFFAYADAGVAHSAELHLALFIVYGLGTLVLVKHRPVFTLALTFFVFNLFVLHSDLSRVFLPLAPFALLVGFDGVLSQRACRWALPFLVYLGCVYAWHVIPHNLVVAPVYQALLRALAPSP